MEDKDIKEILRELSQAKGYTNRAEKQIKGMYGCMQTGFGNLPAALDESIACIQDLLAGVLDRMQKASDKPKPKKPAKK